MPWKASSVLEERIKFVVMASRGERRMVELCREFGISRQTGYKWIERHKEHRLHNDKGGANPTRLMDLRHGLKLRALATILWAV